MTFDTSLIGKFVRTAFVLVICAAISGCDEIGGDFTLGGPSRNNYFLGKSNPNAFQPALNAAQSCVWSGAKNCGIKIDAAKTYARSDFDLYSAERLSIDYWSSQGKIPDAQRSAINLLRELPGNSYATDFLRKNPLPPRPDISFSRSDLLIVAGIAAVVSGGGAGIAAPSNSGASTPSGAKASQVSGGYKITETIPYQRGIQEVVARGRCNNGKTFNVRYYPNNGPDSDYAIYTLFGRNISDVAQKFCR